MSDPELRTAGLALLKAPFSIVGVLIFSFHRLWCAVLNDRYLAPISPGVQEVLGPLLPELDLDQVWVAPRAQLVLPRAFRAITLGRCIYVRGDWDPRSLGDVRLLLHELVHVGQYVRDGWGWLGFAGRYGAGVVGPWSWAGHPMEIEAIDHEHLSAAVLAERFAEACLRPTYPQSRTDRPAV